MTFFKSLTLLLILLVNFCLVPSLTSSSSNQTKESLCKNQTAICHDRPDGEEFSLCPDGWFRWLGNDHCYLIEATKLNWSSANKECAKKDSHLIVLNSYDENVMLSELMYGFQLSQAWVKIIELIE